MKIEDILNKLLGNIQPTGSHEIDMERLCNIEKYNDVLFYIVGELLEASKSKNDIRASMCQIGEKANNVLLELKETLEDIEE